MLQSVIGWIAGRSVERKYVSLYQATKDAAAVFTNKFQVVHANTDFLNKIAYGIRHDVYCSELNYENVRSTGAEVDPYDMHSDQLLLLNNPSQEYVGCVRLIHGRTSAGSFPLPFEKLCGDTLDSRIIRMVKDSGDKYMEVSRLSVLRDFRNQERASISDKHEKNPRVSSGGLITLYLGIQAYAQAQGVKYLFAIVQERLLKSMHRLSIPAVQIGPAIEHRGARVPIMIAVKDVEHIIPFVLKPKYKHICDYMGQSESFSL